LRDPLKDDLLFLHERDAKNSNSICEDLSNIPIGHEKKCVEELLDHIAAILLEIVPEVHLVLYDGVVVIERWCLTIEKVFLQRSEHFFDESVEDLSCFSIFNSD